MTGSEALNQADRHFIHMRPGVGPDAPDSARAEVPAESEGDSCVVRDAFLEEIVSIPYNPRPLTSNPHYYWNVFKSAADVVTHNMPRYGGLMVRANPYPKPFSSVDVPLEDGESIKGWLGSQKGETRGVVFVPGTFHSKDDTARKYKAIKMWREWGVRVLAIDMRGFGESHGVWGAGGVLEKRDILAAARYLLEDGATDVTVVGESLGGASCLLAAAEPDAPELIAGGVLAWSAYADLAKQVAYTVTNPGRAHPFFLPYNFFRLMLWSTTNRTHSRFDTFLSERADELGMSLEALYAGGSVANVADRIRVPTIAFHARDDPIVPVSHAELLAHASRMNRQVRVAIHGTGNHCFFDETDFEWYWATSRAFVERNTARAEDALDARAGSDEIATS